MPTVSSKPAMHKVLEPKKRTPPPNTTSAHKQTTRHPQAKKKPAMPHHHHHRRHGATGEEEEPPSPRPSAAAGCYTFLRSASRRGGYRRLDPAAAAAGGGASVRVEVGTTMGERSVFNVDPAVLESGPVRRLVAAAGRRIQGGAVAVAVDALLFEHLLWLQAAGNEGLNYDEDDSAAAADLSEIVEFYSQDDDAGHRGF